MSYDKKGLGVAEMTFISVNYPETFQLLWDLMDTDEQKALNLARNFIEAYNNGLIEKV